MNHFEIDLNSIIQEKRFNPRYFHFLKARDKFLNKSNIKFINLGNTEYFPLVSDGIHTGVKPITDGEIKYLYVHNLKNGIIDVRDNIFLSKLDSDKFKNKILDNDTVLLSVVGTVGLTAIFKDYVKYTTSLPRNIAYIKTNSSKILPEYLTCFFMSFFSKIQTYSSSGGNNQGLVSLNKLKKFKIPLLKMNKQKILADILLEIIKIEKKFLNSIDETKKNFRDYFKLNDKLFEKINIFSAEINNMKDSNIWNATFFDPTWDKIKAHIKKKYKIVKLDNYIDPIKGDEIGSINYEIYTEKSDDSLPFIRTSDIYNNQVDLIPDFFCDKNFKKLQNNKFDKYDLIINNDGKVGIPSILTNTDYVFQSHIRSLKIKNKSDISQFYIFGCLLSEFIGEVQFKKNTVIQSTIPTLANRIKQFEIPLSNKKFHDFISKKVKQSFDLLSKKKTLTEKIIKYIDEEINFKDFYN